MNKHEEIPQVVVSLHVKYPDGREKIIPCYSWAECGQHEGCFMGVAVTERRAIGGGKNGVV